nr:DUF5688 family protein [uncultured Sellimonas sp.]
MEYQLFLSNVKESLQEKLPGEVLIEDYTATKNNGEIRRGFLFRKEEESISPIVYMEDYYERYLHGMEIKGVTDGLLEWYRQSQKIPDTVLEAEYLKDYERMKGKIVYRLINKEKNRMLLEEIPHLSYLDLDIVFCVLFSVEKYSAVSMLIRNEHLRAWGITLDDVKRAAGRNTPRLLPAELQDIQNVVMELFPGCEADHQFDGLMYVLTNVQRSHGAAAILYPGLLELIGEEWKENFYILPSSIHEVLLVPESKSPGICELRDAVYSINRSEVAEEEFLSDTVYYYNYRKKRLCM